jgi:hypothetical protein
VADIKKLPIGDGLKTHVATCLEFTSRDFQAADWTRQPWEGGAPAVLDGVVSTEAEDIPTGGTLTVVWFGSRIIFHTRGGNPTDLGEEYALRDLNGETVETQLYRVVKTYTFTNQPDGQRPATLLAQSAEVYRKSVTSFRRFFGGFRNELDAFGNPKTSLPDGEDEVVTLVPIAPGTGSDDLIVDLETDTTVTGLDVTAVLLTPLYALNVFDPFGVTVDAIPVIDFDVISDADFAAMPILHFALVDNISETVEHSFS